MLSAVAPAATAAVAACLHSRRIPVSGSIHARFIVCTLLACLAHPAHAADAMTATPVLRVGGQAFNAADYRALAQPDLPEGSAPQRLSEPQVVRAFADRVLLLAQARRDRLQDDPVVAMRIRHATDAILADAALARLEDGVAAGPAQLLRQFQAHPHDYDEVHLSHLFVAFAPDSGARAGRRLSDEQALERARALKRQLDGGADFAALAASASDDAQSAADGGQLPPTFVRYLDSAFVAPVLALAVGQDSEPVRGPQGYHVIRLQSRTPATFDTAKGQIGVQLREQAAAQAMQSLRDANPVQFDRDAFEAAVR